MNDEREPTDLQGMLHKLSTAADHSDDKGVSLEHMLEAVGTRSFGPVLLLPGLIALSPLSGIPGVPSAMAILIFLASGQLLIGRKRFWMPKFLLRRHIGRRRFEQAMRFMETPARWIDKPLHRRLTFLTRGPGLYAVALCCMVIAITMPPMELMPFAATAAGFSVTLFALSLIARDGLIALLGFLGTAALSVVVIRFLFF
ncbi:exopolysaccharide biosynthesis protein [Coralloluteibacterium thermophilus]|uniref:Exopolysaccharide biosynthesis protein n=1 Tax=Coralloluteibacterium thermophilum TaxID=2707049 RepID=A0ABV9NJ88_9GAMM